MAAGNRQGGLVNKYLDEIKGEGCLLRRSPCPIPFYAMAFCVSKTAIEWN